MGDQSTRSRNEDRYRRPDAVLAPGVLQPLNPLDSSRIHFVLDEDASRDQSENESPAVSPPNYGPHHPEKDEQG